MFENLKKAFTRTETVIEKEYIERPSTYSTINLENVYKTLEQRDAKHKTEFAWLFEPTEGLAWDFNPMLCRELGTQNPFTSMMIDSIVKELSGAPWQIVEADTDIAKRGNPYHRKVSKASTDSTAEEIEYLLSHPDPDHDYQDMVEMWARDWLTVGSSTGILEFPESAFKDDKLLSGVPPNYIRPSDPLTFVKDYKDTYGIVSGYYQYSRKTHRQSMWSRYIAKPEYFGRKEVLWIDFNPQSFSRYGNPPTLDVLEILMSLDLNIKQEQEYLSKGSIPSGALVLQDYDREEAMDYADVVSKETKGKPHKFLVIAGKGGEIKYIPFSYNFKELQFLERMEWYVKTLASAFQVPTSVVGMSPDKVNYATFQGERGNFESNTLAPYLQKLERYINRQLIHPFWGRKYQFEIIPGASEETRSSISRRIVTEYQTGLVRLNEARRQLGYDEVPEGDEFKEPEPEESSFAFSKALREESDHAEFTLQPADIDSLKDKISPQVQELWDELLSNPDFINEIDNMTIKKDIVGLTEIFRQMILQGGLIDKLQTTLKEGTLGPALKTVSDASGKLDLETDLTGITERILNRDMSFVNDYTERMIDNIRDTVADGWNKGQSTQEITDNLRDKATSFSDGQAERIARTELGRATGEARNEFALQHQDKLVEVWLATKDDRTRDEHKDMDGLWKRPNEKFQVSTPDGVVEVTYPQEEFINCRCDVLLRRIDRVDPGKHAGK